MQFDPTNQDSENPETQPSLPLDFDGLLPRSPVGSPTADLHQQYRPFELCFELDDYSANNEALIASIVKALNRSGFALNAEEISALVTAAQSEVIPESTLRDAFSGNSAGYDIEHQSRVVFYSNNPKLRSRVNLYCGEPSREEKEPILQLDSEKPATASVILNLARYSEEDAWAIIDQCAYGSITNLALVYSGVDAIASFTIGADMSFSAIDRTYAARHDLEQQKNEEAPIAITRENSVPRRILIEDASATDIHRGLAALGFDVSLRVLAELTQAARGGRPLDLSRISGLSTAPLGYELTCQRVTAVGNLPFDLTREDLDQFSPDGDCGLFSIKKLNSDLTFSVYQSSIAAFGPEQDRELLLQMCWGGRGPNTAEVFQEVWKDFDAVSSALVGEPIPADLSKLYVDDETGLYLFSGDRLLHLSIVSSQREEFP